MNKTYQVNLENLSVGMVFERDVMNKDGNIVIKKGTVIDTERKSERIKRILFENAHFYFHVSLLDPDQDKEMVGLEECEEEVEEAAAETVVTDEWVAETFKTSQPAEIDFFRSALPEIKKKCSQAMLSLRTGKTSEEKEACLTVLKDSADKGLYIKNCSLSSMQVLQKMKAEKGLVYEYNYRTAITAYNIGEVLKLSPDKLKTLYTASYLANIGLSSIEEDVRDRKAYFHEDYAAFIKHVLHSSVMLKDLSGVDTETKTLILFHHETMDAEGFPLKKAANKIPLLARIILVAELFVYYSFIRCLNPFAALECLRSDYLHQLDLSVILALEKMLKRSYIGQDVHINEINGEIVMVNDITNDFIVKTTDEQYHTFSLNKISAAGVLFV